MLRVSDSEIFASGEVGWEGDGFTREQVVDALAAMEGDITLHLQSPGGDVFQGQSIYNQLSNYPGKVTCIIDSLSASIATVIQCAADTVIAHQNSTVMVHNPFTLAIGDAREFRHTAEVLEKLTDDAAQIYAEKSGRKPGYWREVMDREVYFSASEAKEAGIVDSIIGEEAAEPMQRVVTAVSSVMAGSSRLQGVQARQVYRRKLIDYYGRKR